MLFLPTGPIQEVSLSSGWGDAFVALADRFDLAAAAHSGQAKHLCAVCGKEAGTLTCADGELRRVSFTSVLTQRETPAVRARARQRAGAVRAGLRARALLLPGLRSLLLRRALERDRRLRGRRPRQHPRHLPRGPRAHARGLASRAVGGSPSPSFARPTRSSDDLLDLRPSNPSLARSERRAAHRCHAVVRRLRKLVRKLQQRLVLRRQRQPLEDLERDHPANPRDPHAPRRSRCTYPASWIEIRTGTNVSASTRYSILLRRDGALRAPRSGPAPAGQAQHAPSVDGRLARRLQLTVGEQLANCRRPGRARARPGSSSPRTRPYSASVSLPVSSSSLHELPALRDRPSANV